MASFCLSVTPQLISPSQIRESHQLNLILLVDCFQDNVPDTEQLAFMKTQEFKSATQEAQLMMEQRNNVVESRPLRLKIKTEDHGAQEEFYLLLSSSSTGVEQYVEWSRR